MSQNDRLLIEKGVPVLSKSDRDKLRAKWQNETWDDMLLSLHNYGKYIMLRPTGFGKTYTCACACNIGEDEEYIEAQAEICAKLCDLDNITLNNGKIITDKRLASIKDKKVLFVYTSEILKNTFDKYNHDVKKINKDTGKEEIIPAVIRKDKNGDNRIIYETYASVALHWGDPNYLKNTLRINDIGLIIFDEAQRMGALKTAEALEPALKLIEKYGIYYIGATATHERVTGYDIIDKYFRYDWNESKHTYCWGEHIYSLRDTFESGLIIPPEYKYIIEDGGTKKKYRKEVRQTKEAMVAELKAMDANNPERKALLANIHDLELAVIKNASKDIHDTMMYLYDCPKNYINNLEALDEVEYGSIECPDRLPKYMRFLVFTPNQEALKSIAETRKNCTAATVFGNMVQRTYKDFHDAFGRYGYKVRTTIISSANSVEKNNVNLIDNQELADAEGTEIEKEVAAKYKIKLRSNDDVELGRAVVPQDMVIDLIFSINMLNVGYHVDNITGLVLKRWTGSNQVYLQQLGRCLSSVSDIIPVVFDYVNAVDDRGIKAPLYTYNKETKKVTENADGTINSVDTEEQTKYSAQSSTFNKLELNNSGVILPRDINGNPVDPTDINKIDAAYVIVETGTASVDKILSRCNVYQTRTNAKRIHEYAYSLYSNSVKITGKKVDAANLLSVRTSLTDALLKKNMKLATSDFTINFKAYIEYIRNNQKTLYVLYDALDAYLDGTIGNSRFDVLSYEINSILAASKDVTNSHGAAIKIVVHKDKISELKNNDRIIRVMKEKLINPSVDILYYE